MGNTKKRAGVILVVVLVMVAASCALTFGNDAAGEPYDLSRAAAAERPIAVLIRDIPQLTQTLGAPETVAIIDRAVAQKIIGADDCHMILHLIGHEAYRLYGADFESIAEANKQGTCLDGYLHGVEAEIAASGDIDVQWRFCAYEKEHRLLDSPCYHGVGHSAFELTKNMDRALAQCDQLSGGPEPDLRNCYRGVFSENGNERGGYDTNTGLLMQPLTDSSQKIDASRPFATCESLAQKYRADCYSQLSKLYFVSRSEDGQFGVSSCLGSSNDARAVSSCTNTVSALAVRRMLDTETLEQIVWFLDAVRPGQAQDALRGARDAFFANVRTNEEWVHICDLLENAARGRQCMRLASKS